MGDADRTGSPGLSGRVLKVPAFYVVKKVLGRGGMGMAVLADEVFSVEGCSVKLPSRKVVLKIPIPENLKDADRGLADIVTEATASLGLDNAMHIVRVEGVGVLSMAHLGLSDDPSRKTPFLKMEYLDAGVLHGFLDVHRELGLVVPPQVNAYILKCVALACHEAHSARQMIHRDLCPDNIGFRKSGECKVLDFGIAVKAGTKDASCIEEFAGKITYASWDQVYYLWKIWSEMSKGARFDDVVKRLDRTQLTIESDIFTIGAIGHEIATLEPAFRLKGATYSNFGLLQNCVAVRQARISDYVLLKQSVSRMSVLKSIPAGHDRDVNSLAKILYPAPKVSPKDYPSALALNLDDRIDRPSKLAEYLTDFVLNRVGYGSFGVEHFAAYLRLLKDLHDTVKIDGEDPVKVCESGKYDKRQFRNELDLFYSTGGNGLRKYPFFFAEKTDNR